MLHIYSTPRSNKAEHVRMMHRTYNHAGTGQALNSHIKHQNVGKNLISVILPMVCLFVPDGFAETADLLGFLRTQLS